MVQLFLQYPPFPTNQANLTGNVTGTGYLVRQTSPTLITPALGTPASGVMTNVTGTASGLTAGLATSLAGGSGGTIPYQSAAGVTAMLANGTAGYVLQSNGTTLAPTWVPASSGVTGFTGSLNTSSPNNTINASRLLASGGTTNQDMVLTPKGTGALLAQLPDGTSAGGNKRGDYSVDWQMVRSANSMVGSGNNSVIAGGQDNASTQPWTVVSGGTTNTAGGTGAVVSGGRSNTVNGNYSAIMGGYGLTIQGVGSGGFNGNNVFGATPLTIGDDNVFILGNTDLWLGNTRDQASKLKFFTAQNTAGSFPAASTYYTSFTAGSQAADIAYILPVSQVAGVLTNNGIGKLSWGAGASIDPGGSFSTSGAYGITLTVSGVTNVNLPTTGTLATLAGTEALTNKTLTSPILNFGSDANGDILIRSGGNYTRLAKGSDGKVLTLVSGLPAWATAGGGIGTKYVASVANCSNTAVETTVYTVTIPANTWADNESLTVFLLALHKQNSGGVINITQKLYVNATSYTSMSAVSISNNATEGRTDRGFSIRRVGTDLWLRVSGAFGAGGGVLINNATFMADQFSSTSGNIYSSVDFTSDITISITMQWASANALVYFNPFLGLAYKI